MSKEEKKNVREKLQTAMEIPKELLKDYSRVTIIGAEDVWIENYKSILEYNEDMIRLSNNICIYGMNLSVAEIRKDDILIVGKIKNVEFE
jgi:sporulation protein YqfC